MIFERKALSIMLGNLGFKGKKDLYKEYDQPLSKVESLLRQMFMEWDEWFSDIKQILISLGEISKWFGKVGRGVSHASLDLLQGNLLCTCDRSKFNTLRHKIYHKSSFCNLKTAYPTYLPNIFSSFWMGALGLANPDFLLFFWLPSYLNLSLFLPGAQIK